MAIKSFEQLAASAYHAYCKQLQRTAMQEAAFELDTWAQLPPTERAAWTEVVRQVSAEIAAIH